jgi:protein ImuB
VRTLTVWCPDWPVVAAAAAVAISPGEPIVVVESGLVLACSGAARGHGIRRGMKVREAQTRCPHLTVLRHDPVIEARTFEPVVTALEELTPRVAILRPGLCAVRARGPARYFGSELAAAERFAAHATALGIDCRAGVADGVFAATLAARTIAGGELALVVPTDGDAEFLAPMRIDVLDRPELIDLLRRLGIRTLGAFAALPPREVLARFGSAGAAAHGLARGIDERPIGSHRAAPDLAVQREVNPPIDRIDTAAFLAAAMADELAAALGVRGLACACLDIEVSTEHGPQLHRQWRHDGPMSADDIADRVRWQLEGWASTRAFGDISAGGIIQLRLEPAETVAAGIYQEGLWGGLGELGERAVRAITRVQSLLGQKAVVAAVPNGGYGPADRIHLVPWGDERAAVRESSAPWPGHLPAPSPATVLTERESAAVTDADGHPVGVTSRAAVTAAPTTVSYGGGPAAPVVGWAGPWPVEERWWDPRSARRIARVQVITESGALLLLVENGQWWVEARYD